MDYDVEVVTRKDGSLKPTMLFFSETNVFTVLDQLKDEVEFGGLEGLTITKVTITDVSK